MHRYHYLPDARPPEARVSAWKARERMPDQLGWTDPPKTREELQAALREVIGTVKPLPWMETEQGVKLMMRRASRTPHYLLCPCSKATNGDSYQHEPGRLDFSREPGGGGYFGHTPAGEKRVPVIVPHRDACSAPLLGSLCLILGALLVWRWRRR